MKNKKLKTLKDIEAVNYSVPRIMTPENGEEHDYSKGEPRILDEKYVLHVYSHQLRTLIKEWIIYLDKQGAIAATQHPRGVFQAEILREIFDIGDKDDKK